GLMHMASAVGLDLVALFGPTSPCTGGPVFGARHICLQSDICCDIPCHMKECCMALDCAKDISVDSVFEAACQLLEGKVDNTKSFWKGAIYDGLAREVFNNKSGTGGFRF
ncbi:MAG TPA: glycosyltransferase family 9 protein, partial [Candidatus Omnitrophota bacterium]|nr:glycosyltransferase family 9 protein [Candidatus Omnitrophota bacterium]